MVLSSSHIATPSSTWGGVLTLLPCSSVGSLGSEAVLRELVQQESSPGLQFFMNCSGLGPPWVQSFRSWLLQGWSPKGPQVLPRSCTTAGSPWAQSPLGSTCSSVGSSMGCGRISLPFCCAFFPHFLNTLSKRFYPVTYGLSHGWPIGSSWSCLV